MTLTQAERDPDDQNENTTSRSRRWAYRGLKVVGLLLVLGAVLAVGLLAGSRITMEQLEKDRYMVIDLDGENDEIVEEYFTDGI